MTGCQQQQSRHRCTWAAPSGCVNCFVTSASLPEHHASDRRSSVSSLWCAAYVCCSLKQEVCTCCRSIRRSPAALALEAESRWECWEEKPQGLQSQSQGLQCSAGSCPQSVAGPAEAWMSHCAQHCASRLCEWHSRPPRQSCPCNQALSLPMPAFHNVPAMSMNAYKGSPCGVIRLEHEAALTQLLRALQQAWLTP